MPGKKPGNPGNFYPGLPVYPVRYLNHAPDTGSKLQAASAWPEPIRDTRA